MEGVPTSGENQDNKNEQEVSFEQQKSLADALAQAVNKRNDFIREQGYGSSEDFFEVGHHVPGVDAVYDQLEGVVTQATKDFDAGVADKAKFAEWLRASGDVATADMITGMFGLSTKKKSGLFSRFFKGKK